MSRILGEKTVSHTFETTDGVINRRSPAFIKTLEINNASGGGRADWLHSRAGKAPTLSQLGLWPGEASMKHLQTQPESQESPIAGWLEVPWTPSRGRGARVTLSSLPTMSQNSQNPEEVLFWIPVQVITMEECFRSFFSSKPIKKRVACSVALICGENYEENLCGWCSLVKPMNKWGA